jgi:hypothetical protein
MSTNPKLNTLNPVFLCRPIRAITGAKPTQAEVWAKLSRAFGPTTPDAKVEVLNGARS